MSNTLFQLTAEMAAIESALEENGGELTPEIEQALTETSESLQAKADNYFAIIRKMDAYATNIETEIKRLQALKKTADNSVKTLKRHVQGAMEAFGIEQIEGSICKLSLAKSPVSTEINEDEFLLPYMATIRTAQASLPDFITLTPKISATKVKEAFYGKDIIPAGVAFNDTNKSLRIK